MKTKNDRPVIPVVNIDRLRMGTDGHGIRTIIFAEGCPLRCRYCINPHTWNTTADIIDLTPEELFQKVRIDNLYFLATGGGITFGGGEPLMYGEFIREFAEIMPAEWDIVVETSLNVPWENVMQVSGCVSQFFVDIKAYGDEKYMAYTGRSGERAFDNLGRLIEICPEKVIVRIPVIPGYTSEQDCDVYEKKLREMGVLNIDRYIYRKI